MSLPETTSTTTPVEPAELARHLHAVDAETTVIPPVAGPAMPSTPDTSTEVTTVRRAASWAKTVFTPASGLYNDRQPSVAETVRRARCGTQYADTSPLRVLGTAHGWLAAANKAVVHTWVWVVDHPARLTVVLVLATVAFAFPATRHVAAALLTPVTWAQHVLS